MAVGMIRSVARIDGQVRRAEGGPVQTIGLPEYFGRLHLGAINGRFYSLCVMASAVGPALFAASHRFTGSFFPALYICLGLPLVGLFLTAGLKRHGTYRSAA